MPKRSADIEIIPWWHDFDTIHHEDVVSFVKKLPKNSSLAVEVSPKSRIMIDRFRDLLIGTAPSSARVDKEGRDAIEALSKALPVQRMLAITSPSWALLEVLHECEKRNIAIIPIETPVVSAKEDKAEVLYNRLNGRAFAAAKTYKEKSFARLVQTSLWKSKEKTFRMLVGASHAGNTKTELEMLGISASINTGIFTKKKELKKTMALGRKLHEAIWQNKDSIAAKIAKSRKRFSDIPRRENSLDARKRIIQEMRRKAERPGTMPAKRRAKKPRPPRRPR